MAASLTEELLALFRAGVDRPLPDPEFNELALRVFRHQVEANPTYGEYARRRGVEPDGVDRWERIPPVPASAFKALDLVAGDPAEARLVFRTSGTTRGGGRRGVHHVLDPRLYHGSLLATFAAYVLPDGAALPVLALLPSPEAAPDSSLSHMVGVVSARLGAPGGGWFVDPERGVLREALEQTLSRAQDAGEPVLLVGTAFALVHWMEGEGGRAPRFRLPDGSRIVETGGFKGRARALSRAELHGALSESLGVPGHRIVNEYGMTELLSQFYEPHLRLGEAVDEESHRHVGPPWVRTRILDPVSLEPLPAGRTGLLCHLDLANGGSVAAILTEDVGRRHRDGFRVLGRSPGAEPRGCSLAMDELLSAAGGRR